MTLAQMNRLAPTEFAVGRNRSKSQGTRCGLMRLKIRWRPAISFRPCIRERSYFLDRGALPTTGPIDSTKL